MHRYSTAGINHNLKQRDNVARLDVRPTSHARSQHERNNPGRRFELKKRSEAFKKSERAKRDRWTVELGVFAGRKREGFDGVPPRTRLWTGSKQRRLFT